MYDPFVPFHCRGVYLAPVCFPVLSVFFKTVAVCFSDPSRSLHLLTRNLTQVYLRLVHYVVNFLTAISYSLFKYVYSLYILNGLFKTVSCFKKCTNRNRGQVCRCCLDKIVALGTRQWRCRRRRACTRSIRRLARWSNECSWSATSGNSFESSSEKLQ